MIANHASDDSVVTAYITTLSGKAATTIDVYRRTLGQFLGWLGAHPGNTATFQPAAFTRTAVERYLSDLEAAGTSLSHRARVRAVLRGFARWLIEEKGLLQHNPVRGVALPAQPLRVPRELSPEQRSVLRSLVERDGTPRSAAIFALGYWAGCRVSDIAWQELAHTHVTSKSGWLHVGHKSGKARDIDLHDEARRAVYDYLHHGGRDPDSRYLFTSQRSDRLTEAGIHHWFRDLKAQATPTEWDLIADVSFHDLRHDFAHRARVAGWRLEEVAYYLGHMTKNGLPTIQTTARYIPVSREQVKQRVRQVGG